MVMFPAIIMVALFSFVAVVVWSANRRRERENFYHNETVRKIAEAHGQPALIEYMREAERLRTRRTQAALTVGGLIAASGGAGLMLFMWAVEGLREEKMFFVGFIPVFVGLSLVAYSQLTRPKA
jgi:hypothetical protein